MTEPPPPPGAPPTSSLPPAPRVELINTSRWYGNVVAVNDISFQLGRGITGLLGPNGAGKSTILHMLAGFLQPSQGEVRIFGEHTWRNVDLYRRVGLVPEREAIYTFLTGREFVELAARLQGLRDPAAATARAIDMVDMADFADRATGGYSKGMKQRAKVAAALVHDPEVLLLDEPFNGADPRQRLHMIDLFRRLAAEGRTLVFSSHILEEVERLAENVLVIVSGRLAASGDFREIRKLMTDRPHTFTLRTNDNRKLAAALIGEESIFGIELDTDVITVRTSQFAAFTAVVPKVARHEGVSIFELRPTDESLESVFSYLVKR